MSDRERLRAEMRRRFQEAGFNMAWVKSDDFLDCLLACVEQVWPVPRPLPTKELQTVQALLEHPVTAAMVSKEQVRHLLNHLRALEKDLDAAVRQIHDLRLYNEAFEQGRQAGLGEAVELIRQDARMIVKDSQQFDGKYRRDMEGAAEHYSNLADAIEALGPLPEPATIAALRAELAAAQQQGKSRGTANLEVMDL